MMLLGMVLSQTLCCECSGMKSFFHYFLPFVFRFPTKMLPFPSLFPPPNCSSFHSKRLTCPTSTHLPVNVTWFLPSLPFSLYMATLGHLSLSIAQWGLGLSFKSTRTLRIQSFYPGNPARGGRGISHHPVFKLALTPVFQTVAHWHLQQKTLLQKVTFPPPDTTRANKPPVLGLVCTFGRTGVSKFWVCPEVSGVNQLIGHRPIIFLTRLIPNLSLSRPTLSLQQTLTLWMWGI